MTDDAGLEMVKLQIEETPTVMVPLTGEVVDLRQPREVAHALQAVRDAKRELDNARRLLEGVLLLESQRVGTKTLHLGRVDAVVSGGERPEYDAELLRDLLREAGLPEQRIAETVVEVVSYKVDGRELRKLAGSNPCYRDAIEAAKTMVEAPWRVTIRDGR